MKKTHQPILLGVNVDHIATLRQARGTSYPDPAQAAKIASEAGADGITVHLREDRRHIQEEDVFNIQQQVRLPLNLEIAATNEMLQFALKIKPQECCIVPEKREELTTEGGLDVVTQESELLDFVTELKSADIKVSMFIDAEASQLEASKRINADIIELHTGSYADAKTDKQAAIELARIQQASELGAELGLQVNAGHGLHYQNTQDIAFIPQIECLNIGHAIVARASMTGFNDAVFSMKQLMIKARLQAEENG